VRVYGPPEYTDASFPESSCLSQNVQEKMPRSPQPYHRRNSAPRSLQANEQAHQTKQRRDALVLGHIYAPAFPLPADTRLPAKYCGKLLVVYRSLDATRYAVDLLRHTSHVTRHTSHHSFVHKARIARDCAPVIHTATALLTT
jgi:hypothetical protein